MDYDIAKFIYPGITGIIGIASYMFKIYFFDGSGMSFVRPPKIAGTYKTEYISPRADDWGSETVIIKQFGKYLWGTISEKDTTYSVKFSGTVNHNRIIHYRFYPNDSSSNDYGNGLLQLDKYAEEATGCVLFLDEKNQTPVALKVRIKKI